LYMSMFLFLPVICSTLFTVPIYYILKIRSVAILTSLMFLVFAAEYFVYTHFASQMNLMNGVYNGILSLLLFSVYFLRAVSSKKSK